MLTSRLDPLPEPTDEHADRLLVLLRRAIGRIDHALGPKGKGVISCDEVPYGAHEETLAPVLRFNVNNSADAVYELSDALLLLSHELVKGVRRA